MTRTVMMRIGGSRPLTMGLMSLILATLSWAWATDLRAEPQAPTEPAGLTGSQADAILEELKAIRKLLERIDQKQGAAQAPIFPRPSVPPPSPRAQVSIGGEPALGEASAPVTVVEFTDYQCPFCLRFIQETFTKLKQEYIDTGKVRWVVRDLPLGFHSHARKAAQAAHCAGDQGKFWEMRNVLFANAKQLEREKLAKYAQVVGLDQDAFIACLASDKYLDGIDQDIQDASALRITGTPTFIVGKATGDVVDGQRIVGAREYGVFSGEIQRLLQAGAPAPTGSGTGAAPAEPRS
jgi:protein-disulfide isomerase